MASTSLATIKPPQLVSISSVTSYSVRVSWIASSKPAVKNFLVESIGTFVDLQTTVVNVTGEATYVVIDGLTSGERYNFRVVAISNSGTASDWSNNLQADTVMIPLKVMAESIHERSITVSWASRAKVAIRETQVTYQGTVENRLLRIKTIYNDRIATLDGLYPGDLYNVEVKAISPTYKQANAKELFGTRPFPPTLEPINYYNVSSIEIGVKPPTNSIVHSFNVSIQQQNQTKITYLHVLNLGSSVTNFVIPNLVSGGVYEISMACIGYNQHSTSSWRRIKHTARLYAPMIQKHRIAVLMDRINIYWIYRDYIDSSHFLITYYAVNGKKMSSHSINRMRRSVQLQNLISGETYTVIVKAINGFEFVSSQPINITTSLGRLRVEPITLYTSTSITLSWATSAANTIIEFFAISYTGAHLDRPQNSFNVSGEMRTYVLSHLTPGETYSISLQARSGQQAADGNHISQTTIPCTPTLISAPKTTMESIHLSWEIPTKSVVEVYKIIYYSLSDTVVHEGSSPREGYIMKTLKPGLAYNISIWAVSASEKSSKASTIQRTKLGRPREIRVDKVTNTSFTLTWTDPLGSFEYITVSCQKCLIRDWKVFPGTNEANFIKLLAGTQYRLSLVTGKRGFEDSLPATIVEVTKPHTPENLKIISYSEKDVSFAWTDKDCTSCFYRVQCIAFMDGLSFYDDLWSKNITSYYEYSCNDLVPGELYTITVTSLINNDLSFRSPSLFIQQRTEPAIPNKIHILTRTSQSVTLAWEKAEGIFDYYTTKLVSSKHYLLANYSPEVTTVEGRNLDPFLGYDFYISTVSGQLLSEARHIHFNTKEGRPGQVSEFKLMPVNPTKISVQFKQPSNSNGKILAYRISYQGSASNVSIFL
ncbi:fibronectin-like [Anneissia japonica]|uniref:fibronectin-like n=1 Tax=Anneissia japonica TaxID=1529436 RepID=UPI0014257576|nr:fibronectin-like [Anneissia japonica]